MTQRTASDDRETRMQHEVHVFDNGVKVFDRHLLPDQRARYRKANVHEADEEPIFVALIEALPEDGCFVSIGSAIGYYLILARKLAPRLEVHAVEPLEMHRRYFRENLELNGLDPDDFVVHETAIASSEGHETFLQASYGSRVVSRNRTPTLLKARLRSGAKRFLHGLGLIDNPASAHRATKIRTITMDRLLATIGRPADLVQMDVQGLEAEILRAAGTSLEAGDVKTFLIGTHGRRVHAECLRTLRSRGYSIEYEEEETRGQPDGIIVASRGVTRLAMPTSNT